MAIKERTMDYKGTELSEAKRRLGQAKTLYQRLLDRHRKAEQAYMEKIELLQERVNALEAKQTN
jgi:hypothetical protein